MPDCSDHHQPILAAHRGRPRLVSDSSAEVVRVEVRLPREIAADIYAIADQQKVTISHAVAQAWLASGGGGGAV